MKNTLAKDTSRRLFYNFVGNAFTAEELRNARAVVLLGKDLLEIPYLDKLGISRHRIMCIENKLDIFLELHFWNRERNPREKIELYYDELIDYLRFLTVREQHVSIFNLDIFGSLQNKIMPQFEKIITLSRTQPKTVIGTYLTAGRDADILVNSIHATAWLMMFDKEFKSVVERLVHYFVLVGYSKSVAFTHSFRVMQWLYHMLKTLVSVHHPGKIKAMDLSVVDAQFWADAFGANSTLSWENFTAAVAKRKPVAQRIKKLGFVTAPTKIEFVAYRSGHWTQLCHFMKLEKQADLTVASVTKMMCDGLMRFSFAEPNGNLMILIKGKQIPSYDTEKILPPRSTAMLRKKTAFQEPPKAPAKPAKKVAKKKQANPKPVEEKQLPAAPPAVAEPVVTPPPPPKHSLWTKKDGFTEKGKTFLRKLGADGKTPREVAEHFPKGAPFRSIVAMVSHTHRVKAG